ncbi:MAG TPA: tetratricopeptide repeat protein [Sandaracinaceae bacterium LLY-WYZ-13_1]|nr:tetratricopeptide repeat protein [Sandaracinaceae bacterium LLY-WYZ-13_1]
MGRHLWAGLLAATFLWPMARASAQTEPEEGAEAAGETETDDASEAEAREHFEIGRRYYDLGRFQEAADEFRRAYELSGRPALLMNIYLSYRDAAEPGPAAEALREYVRLSELPEEERRRLEARARALERRATDGDEPADDEAPPGRGPDVVGPAVLLGAGGAVLLAGVGTGIATAVEHGALEDACPAQRCEPAESERIDRVRALSIATDVLLPLGLAAAAAGVVWLLVELDSGGDDGTASARLTCHGLGCQLGGRF